jgi:RNA polymerase sigma-70 factor, ECF subfamily
LATHPAPDVTHLLIAWGKGDAEAQERLLPLVYGELRRIAHAKMRAEFDRGRTLQTTALVNEAYVRLVDGTRVHWQNRVHFYALCASLMRRILIDRARARMAKKRGAEGGAVPMADWLVGVAARNEELLAIDEALARLAVRDPRKARVVELRYFGGMTVEEAAEALGISPETVVRDWKIARLWLTKELRAVT